SATLRVGIAQQSIKKREHRGRDKQAALRKQIDLIGMSGAQKSHHQLDSRLRARIGEGMLYIRQVRARTNKSAQESRDRAERADRIEQAKTDRVEEASGIVSCVDGIAIDPPNCRPSLMELLFGHTSVITSEPEAAVL